MQKEAESGPHEAVELGSGTAERRSRHSFPWRGGPLDRVRSWLLSRPFQVAAQLAGGTFIVTLFTFITHLRFERSCLASIFVTVGMVLVAKDGHVGSRLAGASIVIGALWFGALVAACAISLARAPGVAYTTLLIVFLGIGLLITTTVRVKGNMGVGILCNLGLGIMATLGQFVWPAHPLWAHTYTAVLRLALVAALAVAVSGLLVLPTLAGDDIRLQLSSVLQDLGQIVSDGAGHLLVRREEVTHKPEEGDWDAATADARRLVLTMLEEVRDNETIEMASRPGADAPPPWARKTGGRSLRDLRVRMAGCRDLFREASVEPPILRWGGRPFDVRKWAAVMNSLDTLILRIASLESLLEGTHPMMLDSSCQQTIGVSLFPAFRVLFAQIAAACAIAGRAIKIDVDGENNNLVLLFEPSWAIIEYELAGTLYQGLKSIWAKMKAGPNDFIDPTAETRALLYLGTIGNAIMEAMAAVEKSLKAALAQPIAGDTEKTAQPVVDAIRILKEAVAEAGTVNVVKAVPFEPKPASLMVNADMCKPTSTAQDDINETQRPEMGPSLVSFKRSVMARPMQQELKHESLEEPKAGGAQGMPSAADEGRLGPHSESKGSVAKATAALPGAAAAEVLRSQFARQVGWAVPLVKALTAWDVVEVFWDLFTKDIPHTFSSRAQLYKTIWTDRRLQFGVKFYLASLCCLTLLLVIQSHYRETRTWNGLYIDITVVVVLSEKVDATFQKGLFRVLTTVLGGVLGYLVMLDADVATNPYGLCAINVAFSLLFGHFTLGPLKYAIFLMIITFDALVLCAYNGRSAGTVKSFYSRITVTAWGVLLCVAFDLLFPWYVGSSAMDSLGRAFAAAGEVMQHFQKVMSEELELGYLRGEKMQVAAVQQKAGLHQLEQGILQKRIAAPLGGIQVSLEKEGVLWSRGILALPRIVRETIKHLQAVLDRLAAVELMLLQKPVVSGRYSGCPWHYLHEPLREHGADLSSKVVALCRATGAVMSEHPAPQDLPNLEEAIHELHQSRLRWRAAYREKLAIFSSKIAAPEPVEPLIKARSVDDGIRYQSVMFSYSKAIDKLMLLARAIAEDPWMQQRVAHPHAWQTWRSWIGKYGY